MEKDVIEIDGCTYRRECSESEKLRIVIVDNRGLTFVGKVDFSGDDEFIRIRDAQCIIVWGTSHHLAELVCGPTKETRLGHRADVVVSRHKIVAYYDCVSGW